MIQNACRVWKVHAGTRLAWHLGVSLWMGMCYFPPQWWPVRPAAGVPAMPWEDAVPLMPWWAVVYQSVFLLHCAAFWSGDDLAAMRRYGLSVAAAFTAGAIIFWCWPTIIERPGNDNPAFHLLISIFDSPRNALPSLHAALSAFAVVRFWKGASLSGRVALGAWWIALLFSTLATKQHRVIDLMLGLLLAALIAWRLQPSTSSGKRPIATLLERGERASPPSVQSA